MPTYAYTCTACGHSLEARQAFTDPALTECPECSGRLRKRYDAVGVVFKGSGFYRNDSRTDAKNGSTGSGDSGSGAGSGAASGASGAGSSGSGDGGSSTSTSSGSATSSGTTTTTGSGSR